MMIRRVLAAAAMATVCAPAVGDYVAVSWLHGEIWRLDEATGSTVLIGELGSSWRANAMARSGDGRYFVSAERAGLAGEWLFEIDPVTGGSTQLFNTGLTDIRSMAFAPDGTLHAVQYAGVTDSELWAIDVEAQLVGDPRTLFGVGAGVSPGIQGFAIDGAGVGYMAGPNQQLRRVNLETGAVTAIALFGDRVGVQSLAFRPDGGLVGLGYESGDAASLWTYDIATAEVTSETFFEFQDFRGIEWVAPAPSALAAFGVGVAFAARRRRG